MVLYQNTLKRLERDVFLILRLFIVQNQNFTNNHKDVRDQKKAVKSGGRQKSLGSQILGSCINHEN